MRSVSYRLADLIKARIPLGFVGENEHTVVQFDAKQAFDQYPTATPSLTVKNPSGEKYPAVVVRDGDMVIWTISDSDLIVPGHGEFQLQFKEGDTVMRSYVGETRIERSIMPTGDVPTPVQNWIDAAEDVLEEVEEAIPAGGTTGQVLAKKTNADRDLEWVDQTGGGGGTTNYNALSNKPQIAGVELSGDKSLHDLGIAAESAIPDVSGFYTKPSSGIPKTDLASGVKTSLGKADTAYQKPSGGIPASDIADGVIPDVSGFYTKPASGIPASDLAAGVIPDVSGFYTKPAGGIPASDIADGVIPTVHNVPAGGSANQVLAKNSGTDYDLKWVNQSGGGGGGAEIDDTAGEGDTTVVWSADKTWTETNELKEAIAQLAENGYYTDGSGQAQDVYLTLTTGGINSTGAIASNTEKGYIWLSAEQEAKSLKLDTDTYKYNLCYMNGASVAKYTGWMTDSPIVFDETTHTQIGITVTKKNGGDIRTLLSQILYYTEGGSQTVGNLATKEFVENYVPNGLKCIYPDDFTSRIKPNIFNIGRFVADIDLDDYKISGTGEIWVATDGNDTTGDGTESKPYATITKALTESAVTIHIKEGTYTQGTHYATSADLAGKNIIGHGTVIFENDSSGHYIHVSASAYIEGVIFKHGNATTNTAFYAKCSTSGQTVCFVRCVFRDGGTNGLSVEGIDVIAIGCVSYGNKLDGFNYHARTVSSVTYIPNVMEIDCVSYNNGTEQSGSDSCNGSTAHDGVQVVRLNGEYYSCYGGVIAEIGGTGEGDPTTKSVNFGVLAHESNGTGTYKASFWASYNTEMYLYDCKSFGGTYDISAINDAKVVAWRLTTGRDEPAINKGASATVIEH